MPTNDYLPWATGGGANVESQAAYVTDPAVPIGVAHGTAVSALVNKTWRQSSIAGYSLGQIICDVLGVDALDNGVVATFLANLKLAITALAWTAGDVKLTYKTAADPGWLLMADQTIGSGASGAAYANADAQALFTVLYNNIIDAWAPIFTSAGAATTRGAQGSAAVAWGNNCRLQLCSVLGRSLGGAGAGAGLTARALGEATGAETATLVRSDLPNVTVNVGGASTLVNAGVAPGTITGGTGIGTGVQLSFPLNGGVGQTNVNNMQPTSFINAMVKK